MEWILKATFMIFFNVEMQYYSVSEYCLFGYLYLPRLRCGILWYNSCLFFYPCISIGSVVIQALCGYSVNFPWSLVSCHKMNFQSWALIQYENSLRVYVCGAFHVKCFVVDFNVAIAIAIALQDIDNMTVEVKMFLKIAEIVFRKRKKKWCLLCWMYAGPVF